jgi:hypothetical protein
MGEEEPYHVFPDHGSEGLDSLGILIFLPLAAVAAWFHSRTDPHINDCAVLLFAQSSQSCRSRLLPWFLWMLPYGVLYVAPGCLVLATTMLRSAGQDTVVVVGLAVVSFLCELATNVYLFRSHNKNIVLRVGRRLLFVACCVLLGAACTRSLLDRTDYYGPIRVTKFGFEKYRPAQTVSESNPEWYYYYTIILRLEWGHDWGCSPDFFGSDTWCNVTQEVINECSQKVQCHGSLYQTCIDDSTEKLLISKVESCMLNKYSNISIQYSFDKDVAPWLDSNSPYTVTLPTNCGNCTVLKDTAEPRVLRAASSTEFLFGILFLVAGACLSCLGQRESEEIAYQRTGTDESAGDLQLSEVIVIPADSVFLA